MTQRVENKIARGKLTALPLEHWRDRLAVQVIDRGGDVTATLAVGENERAGLSRDAPLEHGGRTVGQRHDPASALALTFPHPEVAESRTVQRFQGDI